MATSNESKEYGERLREWKKKFTDEWDYRRKLVVFQDGQGNIYTPTTTTSTTTTTTPTGTPVTNTPFSVTIIDSTTPAKTGQVTTKATSDLLKLIGITVGVLLCFLIIVGLCILLCRRSRKKRNRNVSVRRPLEGPEPEDHIYAEIEPLQYGRASDPDGASGNTSDIPLPARKRRRGISSFSGLSTRIQKFFSIKKSDDNQSVFYNRNGESAIQTVAEAPEPPQRNINGNRRDKGRKVQRFESTASRRPLLDGDSQISQVSQPSTSSVELRNSTYNALIKDDASRTSGPYDTLNRQQRQIENDNKTSSEDKSDAHDYFTLQKTEVPDIDEDTPVYTGGSEIMAIDHDAGNMETIEEVDAENDAEPAQPHDYFVLEPHEREKSQRGKSPNKQNSGSTSESVDNIDESTTAKEIVPSYSEKSKPTPKPRVTKGSSIKTSPSHEDDSTALESPSKNKKMNEYIAYSAMSGRSTSKEDEYEVSKLGEAPKPPEKVENDENIEEENDYLKPLEEKARVYVDVFPNPPPRTTSLVHDSAADINKQDLTKNKDTSSSYVSQPPPILSEPPTRRKTSPTKSPAKSPTKPSSRPKSSPAKSTGSQIKSDSSPIKSNSSPIKSNSSPVKSNSSPIKSSSSPVKSNGSPIKVVESPTKSVGSPVKLSGVPTKSTETEV